MKKKVIHIVNGLKVGGAETVLYRLLADKAFLDYEFFVIVLNETGPYASKIANLGIPVYFLPIKKIASIWQLFFLARLIRHIKPDIVQTWMYHADLLGGLIAKACGIKKIIWGIRCEGIGLKRSTQLIKRVCALLSWVIPHAIVTNSRPAAHHHIRCGYHSKKFKLIYNGYDSSKFFPYSKRVSLLNFCDRILPQNAILLGTLARFHKDKDYPTLIQSIDTICENCPHVYFVLCGEGCHENNAELSAQLETLKYCKNVVLINGTHHCVDYLNCLDIFILPSRTESFPNSLAEAMLCGLPCIATDVGEVKNILGNTGYLIPPKNPKALILACCSLINQSINDRQRLGLLAREHIKNNYALTNHTNHLLTLYET